MLALLALACGAGKEEQTSRPSGAPKPAATRADVLLVTVDTLRHDAPGFGGGPEGVSPALDRLASRARIYPRGYAQNVVTLPSHVNILTGLYPYQHGVRENSGFVLRSEVPTLATLLGDEGYATGAFVGAYPLDGRFGLDRGFETYDDDYPKDSSPDQFRFAERRGSEVVERALRWWRAHPDRPRFLWTHLYDPHAPYEPPPEERARFAERPYFGEVAAVDRFLAPLLALVEEEAERPAVVVFTADHGEAIGEHGEVTHGLFAYDATLRIPYVVRAPGLAPGIDPRLVGHVDLVPTILDVLGIAAPPELPGRSLLAPEDPDRTLYFEALSTYYNRDWAPLRGLLSGPWKMISLPLPELYQLLEDPREETNLVQQERGVLGRLRASLPDEDWPPGSREVAPEEAARLRQLGYLSSSSGGRRSFGEKDDPKNLIALDRSLHGFIDAYSRGEIDRAVEIGREIVADRPEMAMGYEHLSLALRERGKGTEAVAVLRSAVDRGLGGSGLLRQLGLTLSEVGRPGEAVALLEPLAVSDDPALLNALGVALTDSGRHRDAVATLERALELDPENTQVLTSLGVAALRLGEPATAQRHLEEALRLNSSLPLAWNTLGVAFSFQGDPYAAIDAWQRAVDLDPRLRDALYNLGMTAAQIGERDTARKALEGYVASAAPGRSDPDVAQAREVLRGLGP